MLLLAGVFVWEQQTSSEASDILSVSPNAPSIATRSVSNGGYIADPVKRSDAAISASATRQLVNVRWTDGDSGWIDGKAFRLYGVDAPEGAPTRAKCRAEQVRALSAADAARSLTRNSDVEIRGSLGTDRYGRDLVLLSVGGKDVASTLVGQGHLMFWAYEAGQAKPDWCG
ncbi:MAG: thermonuclease family protein [Hyphomonas sp.]